LQELPFRFVVFTKGANLSGLERWLPDVVFGKSKSPHGGERLLAQAPDLGKGGEGTHGGRQIGARLSEHAYKLLPQASNDNSFAAVYRNGTGALGSHGDADEDVMRVANCISEDGRPRKIGLKDRDGGRVWFHLVDVATGSVTLVVSQPGEQLRIPIPSGGGYLMCGAGAGASSSWEHEVFTIAVNSLVFFADMTLQSIYQPAAMASAVLVLQGMPPLRKLVTSLPLSDLIDFNTGVLNKGLSSCIVDRSLGYCKQLVLNGLVHPWGEDGKAYSEEERKAFADHFACTLCADCGFDGFEPPPTCIVCPTHVAPCVKGGAPPPQPPAARRAARVV
jgi:hypothetical protein